MTKQEKYDSMPMEIEMDTSHIPTPKHIQDHIEAFGSRPTIIGIHWDNPEQEIMSIEQAIADGIPYNEVTLLSKREQKRYKEGLLLF